MDCQLRLAELVCARLCHDLSGLLGSLTGVLELAASDPPDGEALLLAGGTANEMARRLALLRSAWAGGDETLDLARLRALAGSLPGRRPTLQLSGLPPDIVFGPLAGRMVLNMLLLAAEALPAGGDLTLANAASGDLVATIAGPRAAWPPSLAACLADPAAAWGALAGARALQAPFIALLAQAHGIRLVLLPSDQDGPPPLSVSLPSAV